MSVQNTARFASLPIWVAFLSAVTAACSGDAPEPDEPAPFGASPTIIAPRPPADAPPREPAAAAPQEVADGSPAGASGGDDAPPAAEDTDAEAELSFATDVWPIFNAHCGPCHESQRQGGHNVGSDDVEISFEAAVQNETLILRDLSSGSMPPGCRQSGGDGCVSDAELALIRAWFGAGDPP